MTRFSCTPSEDNSVWRLSIQSAHIDDSGMERLSSFLFRTFWKLSKFIFDKLFIEYFQGQYECQISTEPKISKVFRLNVTGTEIIIQKDKVCQI